MSFRERLEANLQRVPPEVADLIRRYRASVDARNPDPNILAEIQAISDAIDILLQIKRSVVPDRGGKRKRTRRYRR
jgi:hypothetical protein